MSRSDELFQRAQQTIPGGVNSPVRAFRAVGGTPRFIESAQGAHIVDADGRRYIDYVGSWGPMILGHGAPAVVEAIRDQAGRGVSFGAPTELEIDLAEAVRERVPSMEQLRMVNSGTEATMSAIRLARGHTGRDKLLKFEGCYHGHGDALLVKAGSGALTLGVPSSPGVPASFVEHTLSARFNDLDSVDALLAEHAADLACIIVEPVAGNMNCVPPDPGFLEGLRERCDKHGILLGFDEVQSGMGRTGKLLACEWSGVKPDVVSLGKGIAGGFPVGACLATAEAAKGMVAGTHGSTYGGNPLAMAAGNAVLDVLLGDGFLEGVQSIGAQMMESLEAMRRRNDSVIDEVRGKGLFIGVKTKVTNMDVVNAARAKGLITVPAADNVVRLLPPLTIDGTVADEALAILEDVCRDLGQ